MNDQQRMEALRAAAQGRTPQQIAQGVGCEVREVEELIEWNQGELYEIKEELVIRETALRWRGIDVSTFQGAPDYERVKAAGIQFVIARAGYGGNHIDRQFHRNAQECNRLGIPFGVYWFSYALNEDQAAQEARYCLEAVRPYRLEYPIWFDFEYDSIRYAQQQGVTVTGALATRMVAAFCAEIEKAKYYAGFYTNADLARTLLDMTALARYDLWYAWYQPTLNRTAGIWQYSSTGQVDGILGNVDLDESFKDYPSIIRKAGLNGFPAPSEEGGYPPGTPQWQIDGFESLVRRGIIDSPDYWKGRFDGTMTAGEIFGIMGRL